MERLLLKEVLQVWEQIVFYHSKPEAPLEIEYCVQFDLISYKWVFIHYHLRSFFFLSPPPLPPSPLPTSVSLMLGSVVFDAGCYLVYQVTYNIKEFCLYTFHKCKIIFYFYSLIPVTFCATVCEVRGNLYFLDYITLDYFHKIKTGFHKDEQVSWHRERPVARYYLFFFSPSRCGVQTVFRCHPHCLQSSARRQTV